MADIVRLGLIIKSPVEPAGGKPQRNLHRLLVPNSLLPFGGRGMAALVNAQMASAIPAKLRQHDRFADGGHFPHHPLEVGQVLRLFFGRGITIEAVLQGIEMDLEKVEQWCQLRGPEAGVMRERRKQGGD